MILAWAARRLAGKVLTGNLTRKEGAAAALLAVAVEGSASRFVADLNESIGGEEAYKTLDERWDA